MRLSDAQRSWENRRWSQIRLQGRRRFERQRTIYMNLGQRCWRRNRCWFLVLVYPRRRDRDWLDKAWWPRDPYVWHVHHRPCWFLSDREDMWSWWWGGVWFSSWRRGIRRRIGQWLCTWYGWQLVMCRSICSTTWMDMILPRVWNSSIGVYAVEPRLRMVALWNLLPIHHWRGGTRPHSSIQIQLSRPRGERSYRVH